MFVPKNSKWKFKEIIFNDFFVMINQASGPFEMTHRDSWRPELLIGETAENNLETIESKPVFQSMLLKEIITK